jgi:hypothetical protein
MARHSKSVVVLASAMLVLVAGTPAAGAASTTDRTLRMIHLDTAGLTGVVTDVNARGQIVGYLQDGGPIRPTLWHRDGARVDIDAPGGYPHGLNDRGDVLLGSSLASSDPVIWNDGRVTPVAHPSLMVSVMDLNNRRQVVGTLSADSPWRTTAFRWQNGQFTELDGPEGTDTGATAVNERGDVLGGLREPFTGPGTDVFVWRNGTMHLLGLPQERGYVRDFNDRGQVIGDRYVGEFGTHPFLWQRGTMTDLMAGRPDDNGGVTDINNAGDVVGIMDSRPVLWRHGRAILIGPAGSTGVALAVNDHRDVAGFIGFPRGDDIVDGRVFLWRDGRLALAEPIKEPLTPVLVGMDESGRIAGYLTNTEMGDSHPVVWTTR